MTKTLRKNLWRSITGSLGRYIAIVLIIMLGVAFFTGLKLARPAMVATFTDYVRQTELYDLRLISTIGFDDEDVAAATQVDGVESAAGSVQEDFLWEQDGEMLVLRAHMLTEGINEPELTAGRMPETGDECLVDARYFSEDMIGQTITLSADNDADTLDTFAYGEYTVTGLCRTALYLDTERGTSSLGDGSVDAFVLLMPEGFDTEYYTELYLTLDEELTLYSDEYDDRIDVFSDDAEAIVTASVQARFDELVADAEAEIADAEQELADQRAEAQAELDDAWQTLEDARIELEDAEATLADAEAELADAEATLNEAAEQLQSGFTSWENALAAGRAEIADGQDTLDAAIAAGRQQLADSLAQLETLEQTWQDGQAEVDAGTAEYEAYLTQWQAGYDQYAAALEEYTANQAAYEEALAAYQQALAEFEAVQDMLPAETAAQMQAELEATQAVLEQTAAQLAAGKETLDATGAELEATQAALAESLAELEAAQAQLDTLRGELDAGWVAYDAGVAELEQQQAEQQATLDAAESSLDEFEDGIAAYYEGLDEYNEGVQTVADGWSEYEDGLADYQEGVAEFEEEIADAEAEIADAKQELADLEEPTLYVLTRSTNSGYVTFESDSQIVENLATVFPLFFFLIAALVCSTTMTRMVDDDRTQIGTLRALGYSRGAILTKYLTYAASAAVIGCLAGYFLGGYLFPLVIWKAYQMLYNIDNFIGVYDTTLLLLSMAASLLCSAGTTYLSCRRTMASTPADLIRPKTPSAGKRIFLERITPLWRRLKFLHKVTLRNIFRFKKRMFMMLLGIAGCTALLLTGFGIRDSVADIANYQFDDIQKYDLSVTFSDPVTAEELAMLDEACGDQVEVQALALLCSGDLTGSDATKTVYFVASDESTIAEIYDLHLDGEAVPFPGEGEIVITDQLAEQAGVKVGDTVTLSVKDDERSEVTVVGIAENYVYSYVYMTGSTYASLFSEGYEPETLLLRLVDGADEYSVAATLSGMDGVSTVSVVTDTRNAISNMMQSLNYVVALVLACAAALAFIVLFNLGNINISERVREIATIKVLGFHAGETGSYVFRENFILSLMGIVVGLPLGVALHAFVMSQVKVDMVSFKVVIKPVSYLLSVVLVMLFATLTDLILRRKLARINMAESLKSVE